MTIYNLISKGMIVSFFLMLIFTVLQNRSIVSEVHAEEMPPAPIVDILVVKHAAVRLWTRFSGRLTAVDYADIKPLVGGKIEKVFFVDGQFVEKDDPLFLIDPRPYQAVVNRFQAQLASALSINKLAKDELERTRELVNRKLISDSVFDQANNDYEVSRSKINEARSALAEAELDVEYASIKAPFSGQMSRAELTEGNIVEVNTGAPVLASIVSKKQVYAEFNIDEQSYIKAVRHSSDMKEMPVELRLTGDDEMVYQGQLHSFDNQLDATTGTIRTRAIFENSDGVLKPGMYANIRLGSAQEIEALLIPQRAIGTNQAKKYVLLVNEDNIVQYREVVLGQQVDESRLVISGLHEGDKVVINGVSKIRPDMLVILGDEAIVQ